MDTIQTPGANVASPSPDVSTATASPSPAASPKPEVKHNPWADETERFTAEGPVKAAPLKVEKAQAVATPAKPVEIPAAPVAPVAPAQVSAAPTAEEVATTALKRLRAEEAAERQTQAAAPKPLTDAEFDNMFGVVKLSDQDFASIIGFAPEKPEQVAALNGVLQRLNAQSVKMANYMADQKLAALEKKFSSQVEPMVQNTRQAAEERIEGMFFDEYPGLKDYRPLLTEIKDNIVAKGTKFNSAEELINFVASKAATLIGKPVADLKRQAAGGSVRSTQQSPTATPRQMTSTLVGGRAGSGGATNQKPKSTAEHLWGE